jgi:hypothetical protein
LDEVAFWDLWWQQASQAAKLAYVASICGRCRDENGPPSIAAIDRGEAPIRTLMYKPYSALTPEDYAEVKRYFLAMAQYEHRAADLVEALAFHVEGQGIMEPLANDATT